VVIEVLLRWVIAVGGLYRHSPFPPPQGGGKGGGGVTLLISLVLVKK
jgi:hypothetical protein